MRKNSEKSERTDEIAGQIQGEVENEGCCGIEDAAGAFLLGPLDRNVFAAIESVIPENGHVAKTDEDNSTPEGPAHALCDVGDEVAPVEGQHAHLREAHSNIVKVIGSEGNLCQIIINKYEVYFFRREGKARSCILIFRTLDSVTDGSHSSSTPIW